MVVRERNIMKVRLQHVFYKLIHIALKSYILAAVLLSTLCGTMLTSGEFNMLARAQTSVGARLIAPLRQHTQNIQHINNTAPTPFLHRPYYGNQTISARTTSFFDHDKPWYDFDGVFVRYDGTKWTSNDSI